MKRKYYFIIMAAVLMTGLLTGCRNEADETAAHDNLPIEEIIQGEMEDSEAVEADVSTDEALLENYYGYYRITEFLPSLSWWRGHRYDWLPEQEADMLLGRVIELSENRLVTYDSLRHLGKRDGRVAFPGNYIIEEIIIEKPQYSWELVDTDTIDTIDVYDIIPYLDLIDGKISIQIAQPWGKQDYYVMPGGILMFSNLNSEYYYLEKLEEEPEQQLERELSDEEQNEILQKLLGTYIITEFLPTKFYPAPDTAGDPYLPKEEADLMIGREVTIEEDLFVSYDNFRLPNSEFMNRAMDDFWLEQIEISSPDYRVEEKNRKELYGLRDDEMLREDLLLDNYVEISVFPGYSVNGDDCLPQLYLLDDGRIMMYAMGEFFLLEKADDLPKQDTFVGNEYPDVPEVYRAVLRQYEQAIRMKADLEILQKKQSRGEWEDVYWYLFLYSDLDMDTYYCLRDLTCDGFPELIIGHGNPEIIYYCNSDKEIQWAHISEGYYGLTLYEGGVVEYEHGYLFFYVQFQPDTGKWEQVVQREYSWEDDAYRYYRGPSNNLYEISEEEYQQIADGLTRERIELEWTMLDVS